MKPEDKWLLFLSVFNLVLAIIGVVMDGQWWVITLNLVCSVVCAFAAFRL